jgi:hypothetical protein
MKEKITLSVDALAKRRAEAHKKRTGMSLGEIFELGVAHAVEVKTKGRSWDELLGNTLELTDEDARSNDRLGRLATKAKAPRTRRTKRAKRA